MGTYLPFPGNGSQPRQRTFRTQGAEAGCQLDSFPRRAGPTPTSQASPVTRLLFSAFVPWAHSPGGNVKSEWRPAEAERPHQGPVEGSSEPAPEVWGGANDGHFSPPS